MRRGRERLTARNPRIDKAVSSLALDQADIEAIHRFGNKLEADARTWMQRGGFADRGRITKSDAARMFVAAFGSTRPRAAIDHKAAARKLAICGYQWNDHDFLFLAKVNARDALTPEQEARLISLGRAAGALVKGGDR